MGPLIVAMSCCQALCSALILAAQIVRPTTTPEMIVEMVKIYSTGQILLTVSTVITVVVVRAFEAFARART